MRIKFLRNTAVDLNLVPKKAWGCVQVKPKNAAPPALVDGHFTPPTTEIVHCFPVGREVELPDEIANGYIIDGSAELTSHPGGQIIWGPRPDAGVSQ